MERRGFARRLAKKKYLGNLVNEILSKYETLFKSLQTLLRNQLNIFISLLVSVVYHSNHTILLQMIFAICIYKIQLYFQVYFTYHMSNEYKLRNLKIWFLKQTKKFATIKYNLQINNAIMYCSHHSRGYIHVQDLPTRSSVF